MYNKHITAWWSTVERARPPLLFTHDCQFDWFFLFSFLFFLCVSSSSIGNRAFWSATTAKMSCSNCPSASKCATCDGSPSGAVASRYVIWLTTWNNNHHQRNGRSVGGSLAPRSLSHFTIAVYATSYLKDDVLLWNYGLLCYWVSLTQTKTRSSRTKSTKQRETNRTTHRPARM